MTKLKTWMMLILPAFIFMILFSCNSSETKNDAQNADSAAAAFTPFNAIIIKHTVADFSKWLPVFNAHDSVRRAYGQTTIGVGRGMDDSNTVVIISKADDVQKAKDFAALPELKETMQKAGVNSAPEFMYINVIRNDNSVIEQKARMMITHHVKDFDAWLKVYDNEGKTKRMEEGLIDRGLARGIDDPNMVYIVFAVTDMEKAKAAMGSEAKKKLMTDAGVDSAPQVFMYNFEASK